MSAPADLYTIPQEFESFRDQIRKLAQEKIAPRSAELDANAEYPWDIRKLLAENDVLALPFEPEHGGLGTGTLMLNIAIEELAKVDAGVALILMLQELGTLPIKLHGSEELKRRFLPKCASGEWAPAFALSETEAGSDPGAMVTTAVKDGDDWVINGAKNWISNTGVADFYVVFTVTDKAAGHAHGITAFVVEKEREGFSVGRLENKLGIRCSPTGQPIFKNVRVPAENIVGEVGGGFKVAMSTLERSRIGAAAQALGIAQGATDMAVAYANQREQFGKPISSFQGMQFKLADMETRTAAARELVYKACAKVDRGEPDMNKYTSMCKLFASDTAMAVAVEAVQVFGGNGFVKDYPVERFMRDAKITQIYEGTNEIQRVVIARTLR